MIPYDMLPGYKEWKIEKTGELLMLDEYCHLISMQTGESFVGGLLAFISLASPNFMLKRNCLFIEEMFSETRLEKLIEQKLNNETIEYWMNLLTVSLMFPSADDRQCEFIASNLQRLWSDRLFRLGHHLYESRIVNDDDDGYCVIVCRKTQSEHHDAPDGLTPLVS
jgi:hypothetical protein